MRDVIVIFPGFERLCYGCVLKTSPSHFLGVSEAVVMVSGSQIRRRLFCLCVGYVVVFLSWCDRDRRHGAKDDVDMSLCGRGPRHVSGCERGRRRIIWV